MPRPKKLVLVLDFGDFLRTVPNPDDGETTYGRMDKLPKGSHLRWSVAVGERNRLVETRPEAKGLLRDWSQALAESLTCRAERCASRDLLPDGLCVSHSKASVVIAPAEGGGPE